MRSAVLAELTRYRSRRLIVLLLLGAMAIACVVALKSAVDTRPPSKAELSTATVKAKIEANRPDIQNDLQACLKKPAEYLGAGHTADDCRDNLLPAAESFLPRPDLNLGGTLEGNGAGTAALVIALLVIAGSTFAGGDWASGSMTTQLLAQPRRLRLWWAKAGAVAIATTVAAIACLAVFWGILYAVAGARDLAPEGSVTLDVVQQVLRAAVLAAAAAVGAFAVTSAFRSTIGTLSLCFTFAMLGELLIALPFESASRWSISNNVNGWLQKDFRYQSLSACSRAGECSPVEHLSHVGSGLFLLVLLLVAISIGINVFRRADA